MHIVSFNMRASGSAGHWAEMLDRLDPDLAMVQETRDPRNASADRGVAADRLIWEPVAVPRSVRRETAHIVLDQAETARARGDNSRTERHPREIRR